MTTLRWICIVSLLVWSCKKNDLSQLSTCSYVPTYIDTTINLNDKTLASLHTKNYAYLKGGYRGIVVYKVSDTQYNAFDRASTYQMAEVGCRLIVDDASFYLADTCSQSRFDFEGYVIKGPAVCPLLEYRTSFIGSDRLRIFYGGL